MNRIDYLVLTMGLILIIFIFALFSGINIFITMGIVLLIIFLLILSSMILMVYTKQRKLKKIKNEIYIFSSCYINDDVNFSKLMKKIDDENNFKLEDSNCSKFIKLLLDNNLLVKLDTSIEIEELLEKINSLLTTYKIDLNITLEDVINDDTETIKYRRNKLGNTFIYDLNKITKIIRKSGYELVQLCPVNMKSRKFKFYMMIVPITSLLDLNEIGFMG